MLSYYNGVCQSIGVQRFRALGVLGGLCGGVEAEGFGVWEGEGGP